MPRSSSRRLIRFGTVSSKRRKPDWAAWKSTLRQRPEPEDDTNLNGHYNFEGLVAGTYNVMINADTSTMIVAGAGETNVTVGSNSETTERELPTD